MLDSLSFFRVVKTGAVNFWRNLWLSVGAAMVMTITLVIFCILFLLFFITNHSVQAVKDRVDISLYTKKTILEDKVLKLRDEISGFPEVREVSYISSQEVLQEFKTQNQSHPKVLAALNEVTENPFGATLRIKAKQLEDYPKISDRLQGDEYRDVIKEVNYEDNRLIIQRLGEILKIIVTFGFGLVGIFVIIALLVIFNTITLTIHNRKEEVGIMRLVGATNWYIRGPFLIESLLYALSATVMAALLLAPALVYAVPKIIARISPDSTVLHQRVFSFPFLVFMMLAIACLISVISTLLAIRRYLKI